MMWDYKYSEHYKAYIISWGMSAGFGDSIIAKELGISINGYREHLINNYNARYNNVDLKDRIVFDRVEDIAKAIDWLQSIEVTRQFTSDNRSYIHRIMRCRVK